jgi:hypothetical protein
MPALRDPYEPLPRPPRPAAAAPAPAAAPQLNKKLTQQEAAAAGQQTKRGGYFTGDDATGGTRFASFDDPRNRAFGHDEVDTRSQAEKRAFKQKVAGNQAQFKQIIDQGGTEADVSRIMGKTRNKDEGLALFSHMDAIAQGLRPGWEVDWNTGQMRDISTSDPSAANRWVSIDPQMYKDRAAYQASGASTGAEKFGADALQSALKYGHTWVDPETGRYRGYAGTPGEGGREYFVDKFNRPTDSAGRLLQGGGAGAFGGGAAAGGGGGGASRTTASSTPGSLSVEGEMEKLLKGGITGQIGSASDAATQAQLAQAFQAAEGRRQAASEQINADAISRGLSRSSVPSGLQAQASRDAGAQYTQAARDIAINQSKQQYQDRLSALDRAQKMLDSKRQEVLTRERNAIDRDAQMAQISLAYAKIDQERQMLSQQLSAQSSMLGQQNQYAVDQWNRALPLELAKWFGTQG